MGRQPKHRSAIVHAATALFRERGYSATGIADILAASGAPKGSLYHYFPEGKDAVAVASVQLAGDVVNTTLRDLAAKSQDGAGFIRAYMQLLGRWLEDSDFRHGCPIATTLLETTPESLTITAAGDAVLETWRAEISAVLCGPDCAASEADDLATLCISAIEGALLLARVSRSREPLEAVSRQLCRLIESVPDSGEAR